MHPAPAAVVSGEGVELDLPTATVGSRVIAAAVDVAVQAVAFGVLAGVDSAFASGADDAAIAAVVIVELVLILAGYPIIMEWLTRGRTVGKITMGLRVVRDDGGPIGFRQALVRGLSGLVLEKPGLAFPFTTIAGLLTMTINQREKRIGDLLAGTVVRNVRRDADRLVPVPEWIPASLQPWTSALDLSRLDDDLALRMRQFVSRAFGMTDPARVAIGEQLVLAVLGAVTPLPPPGTPQPDILLAVLAERRRRALHAAAPVGGWSRPAPPPPPAGPSPWVTLPGQPAPPAPPQHQPQPQPQPQPPGPFTAPR